jgi:hypothetical protein
MGLNELAGKFLDPYDRQARLYPGLIVLTPLAVVLVCLYGTKYIFASTVLSILGFSGIAYMLGSTARDAGKKVEDKLFAKLGGKPTTLMLRHRDTRIDGVTKNRIHQTLSKGIVATFPSPADELANPQQADETYRAGTVWLISNTRDPKKFPLVFKENIAYGFRRNMLGLKRIGGLVALASVIWTLFHAKVISIYEPYWSMNKFIDLAPSSITALVVSTTILFTWIFLITESSLLRVATAYSERLFHSCDNLKTTRSRSKATP